MIFILAFEKVSYPDFRKKISYILSDDDMISFFKRIKWEMGDTFFKFSLMKFSRLYNRSQSYDSFQMVPSSPSCGSDSGLTSDHDTIGPVSSPYQTFKLEEDSIPVTNSSSIGKNLNWRLLCNFTKFCYKNNEYVN